MAPVLSSLPDVPDFETDGRYSKKPIYFVMGKLDELRAMNEGNRTSTLGLFWKDELIAVIKYKPPRGFFLTWQGRLAAGGAQNLVRRYAKHMALDMTNGKSVLYRYRYDPRSPNMRWRFTQK